MKKLGVASLQLAIIYALPLLGNPGMLLSPKILACMAAATVLFMTQPITSGREARRNKSSDKHTMFIILLCGFLSQVIGVLEWAYVRGAPFGVRNAMVAGLGLVMMVGGIAFRIWSIHTLGRFFTATVQVKAGHHIITSGPYHIVRHPSYLGALVAVVGSAIFLEAPFGTATSIIMMLFAYRLRIAVEEVTLSKALGDSYQEYQRHTKRLIPLVW